MSRNSRNGESAKNRISEFSPNSPFSSKLPFSRAPLPSHLPWKLYFGEFLPYSSNWPLSSKSLLWTAPLCHIIWLVHITMANFCHFTVLAKFAIFVKIANLKWDHWSFLISLVPKALAKFRPVRHFRHERVFPTFLIAGVWIRLYSYISGLLKTATVLFVCFAKCQPLLKPRASAKSHRNWPIFPAKFYTWLYFETKLECFEACKNGLFLVVICQEFYFFLSLTVFKLLGYFTPDHGCSVGNSKLNWVKNVQIITS